MPATRLIALAAALGVILAVPAQATNKPSRPRPKPACNLIVDAAGDEALIAPLPSAAQDPSLDIISADIAADPTRLVGVIRVAKLTDSSQQSPLGREWTLTFALNGKVLGLIANSSPAGGTTGTGPVVLDTAKNEIRISAAWADLTGKPRPAAGDRIGNLQSAAFAPIGYPEGTVLGGSTFAYPGYQRDAAASSMTYAVGAPSCVPLGP